MIAPGYSWTRPMPSSMSSCDIHPRCTVTEWIACKIPIPTALIPAPRNVVINSSRLGTAVLGTGASPRFSTAGT